VCIAYSAAERFGQIAPSGSPGCRRLDRPLDAAAAAAIYVLETGPVAMPHRLSKTDSGAALAFAVAPGTAFAFDFSGPGSRSDRVSERADRSRSESCISEGFRQSGEGAIGRAAEVESAREYSKKVLLEDVRIPLVPVLRRQVLRDIQD
jgi:hypothetical protein